MRSSIYRKLALGGVLFLLLFGVNANAIACVGDFTPPKVQTSEPSKGVKTDCTTEVAILNEFIKESVTPSQQFHFRGDRATAFGMLDNVTIPFTYVWVAVKSDETAVMFALFDEYNCLVDFRMAMFEEAQIIFKVFGIDLQHKKQI